LDYLIFNNLCMKNFSISTKVIFTLSLVLAIVLYFYGFHFYAFRGFLNNFLVRVLFVVVLYIIIVIFGGNYAFYGSGRKFAIFSSILILICGYSYIFVNYNHFVGGDAFLVLPASVLLVLFCAIINFGLGLMSLLIIKKHSNLKKFVDDRMMPREINIDDKK